MELERTSEKHSISNDPVFESVYQTSPALLRRKPLQRDPSCVSKIALGLLPRNAKYSSSNWIGQEVG